MDALDAEGLIVAPGFIDALGRMDDRAERLEDRAVRDEPLAGPGGGAHGACSRTLLRSEGRIVVIWSIGWAS